MEVPIKYTHDVQKEEIIQMADSICVRNICFVQKRHQKGTQRMQITHVAMIHR